jgi:hypothetical protein
MGELGAVEGVSRGRAEGTPGWLETWPRAGHWSALGRSLPDRSQHSRGAGDADRDQAVGAVNARAEESAPAELLRFARGSRGAPFVDASRPRRPPVQARSGVVHSCSSAFHSRAGASPLLGPRARAREKPHPSVRQRRGALTAPPARAPAASPCLPRPPALPLRLLPLPLLLPVLPAPLRFNRR